MPHENDESLFRPSQDESGFVAPSPSLLPDLLRRLGLAKGAEDEPRVSRLQTDLENPAWYIRARAVSELASLGERAPLGVLLSMLDDAHVSVRANAVRVLSELGTRAPVERLVEVLRSDSEWQVRESAALALATLGTRVPGGPLLDALHDPDTTVRHAAYHALERIHPELLAALRSGASELSESSPPQSQSRMPPVSSNGHRMHEHFYEKEGAMSDNRYITEIAASTDGKKNVPEAPSPRKRKTWRVVSLSIAAAVVIINLLAWSILTHTLRGGTHTGSSPASSSATPTVAATPGTAGPLGKTIFVYPPAGTIVPDDFMSVGWSSDGKYISVSGTDVKLLDPSTGKVVKTFDQAFASVWSSWSPDGTRLATSSQTVQIWDIKTGQVLVTYTPKSVQAASLTPHNNPLVQLSGGNMIYASAWSPDSKLIASAIDGNAYGYNVQVWNAATGVLVRTFQIKSNATVNDYITQVGWSSDGKYLAAESPNNGIVVWDATSGNRVYTRPGAQIMAWEPQGDLIASADSNGKIQVWDAATGAVQFSFQGQIGGNVSALAWSPNGKYLAAAGQDVRIWDVAQNKLHYTYTGHGKHKYFNINGLAWSPDSTEIASMGVGMDVTAPHTGISLDSIRVWIAV